LRGGFSKEEWERKCDRRRKTLGDEGFERWRAEFDGSCETLVKDMDEAGGDKAVVFALGNLGLLGCGKCGRDLA